MESFDWNVWKKVPPEKWEKLEESVREAERKAMEEIGNTPEQLAEWRLIKNSSLSKHDVENKTFDKFKIDTESKRPFEIMSSWEPHTNAGSCYGYFLYGPVGSGKTHLMKSLLIKWAGTGRKCKFISIMSLFDEIKDSIEGGRVSEVINSFSDFDILAIDDFGAEKTTPFTQEKFLSILETRLRIGKPTFITSNLTGEDLKERYDIRILDRLREMFLFLNAPGKSYREKIYKERLALQNKA